MFCQECFSYQVALEGVFSQVIKQLHGLMKLAKGQTPEYSKGDTAYIWSVYRNSEKEFSENIVALENWPEKSSIRNAIAHVQAQ